MIATAAATTVTHTMFATLHTFGSGLWACASSDSILASGVQACAPRDSLLASGGHTAADGAEPEDGCTEPGSHE